MDVIQATAGSSSSRPHPSAAPNSWRTIFRENRGFFLVILAAELVIAALFPLARWYDHHVGQARPLVADVQTLAGLEHTELLDAGHARSVTVAPGQATQLGGVQFGTHDGVTVFAKASSSEYCVAGRDTHGDVASWRCWGDKMDPAVNDGLPSDERVPTLPR